MSSLKEDEIEKALNEMFGLSDPEESDDGGESEEDDTTYNATKLQRILEELDEPDLRSTAAIRASLSPQPSTSSDVEVPCAEPLHAIPPLTVTEPVSSSSAVPLPAIPSPAVLLPSEPPTSNESPVRGRGRGTRTDRGSGTVRGTGTGRRTRTGLRGRGAIRSNRISGHGDGDSSDDNASPESEAESDASDSDGDEEAWKKSLWTDIRPQPDLFDSMPMTPTRVLSNNARPIRLIKNLIKLYVIFA